MPLNALLRSRRMIFAATVLVALMASSFAGPANAKTASCSVATAKVKSINLSSQVRGENFRLCADWIKTSIKALPGKTITKPQPVRPPSSSQSSSQANSAAGSKTRITPLNRSVLATANRPTISAFPAQQVAPDTDVLLYSDATRHSVLKNLLGYETLIRFTPVGYRWTTGDGYSSRRSRLHHRFQRLGTNTVRLSVDFAIEIRLVSASKWIKTPFRIKKVADPLAVHVGERKVIQGIPVFVIHNCIVQPTAAGCRAPAP